MVKVDTKWHQRTVIRQPLACAAAGRVTANFHETDTRWSDAEAIAALLRAPDVRWFRKVGVDDHVDAGRTMMVGPAGRPLPRTAF